MFFELELETSSYLEFDTFTAVRGGSLECTLVDGKVGWMVSHAPVTLWLVQGNWSPLASRQIELLMVALSQNGPALSCRSFSL